MGYGRDEVSESEGLDDSGFRCHIEDDDDGYEGGVMWGLKKPPMRRRVIDDDYEAERELRLSGSKPKSISGKTLVKYSDGSVRRETVIKEVGNRVITSERQQELTRLYEVAKAAKVGTDIVCPVCKTMHNKTTYHKVFCSNGRKTNKDCKSKYWNTIHPERLDRVYHQK